MIAQPHPELLEVVTAILDGGRPQRGGADLEVALDHATDLRLGDGRHLVA